MGTFHVGELTISYAVIQAPGEPFFVNLVSFIESGGGAQLDLQLSSDAPQRSASRPHVSLGG